MIDISKTINQTRITLARGDITKERVDAVVNAANSSLLGGGGVDGAIHRAGGPAILEECKRIRATTHKGGCPAGEAVITGGGNLIARHVVHTVGPIWQGGKKGEPEVLGNAYRNSLQLAAGAGCKTVAFPSISTGAYGYPVEKAGKVALAAIEEFLQSNSSLEEVRFVLFDETTFQAYRDALDAIE
jgi:O-acetyl-ADP-ribose deacetylase (regulator of RNase III)